jgi:hypothetical protein
MSQGNYQLTLGQWLEMAVTLGVEKNDREHAAKIIANRRRAA